MPIDPTPIRKRIFEFPTPNLNDRVFHELHDSTQLNYAVPPYGTLHPNQTKYEGFKLAMVKPANESGWAYWFYLNERLNQDEYNYEIQYPYPNTDYPVYVRTYVLPRSSLPEAEPAAGSEYPPEGSGFFLTDHKQIRLQDPLMDSLFVGVQRVYERLPGPEIDKYRYNERGDLEHEINQIVPAARMPDSDGLYVMESLVNHDTTVKGTRKVRTVDQHSTLTSVKKSDSVRGATVTSTNDLVTPTTPPDQLSLTTLESEVVQRTKTKAERTTVKIDEWPTLTTKRTSEDARGATIKTISDIVSPNAAPAVLNVNTLESSVVQKSKYLAEKTTTSVDSWPTLVSKSYPGEYKGSLATAINDIVSPSVQPDTPGTSTDTGIVVESQVVQRNPYRAEKTTTTIPEWPVLFDFIYDNEIGRWVQLRTEIVPAVTSITNYGPVGGRDYEIRAIDKYWSSVTTREVIDYGSVEITETEYVEYNIPPMLEYIVANAIKKKVRDRTEVIGSTSQFTINTKIKSPRRVWVKATTTTTFSDDSTYTGPVPTQITPVELTYDGPLLKINTGPVLTGAMSGQRIWAQTGSDDYYWTTYSAGGTTLAGDFYDVPISTPAYLPQTLVFPAKITKWKYGLYKIEKTELDLSQYSNEP
jgi:hypothetical protein